MPISIGIGTSLLGKVVDASIEPIKVPKKRTSSNTIEQIGTYRIFTLRLVTRTLALPLEELRRTPLGQHLTAIAHYAEGYPYLWEGDVRNSMSFVARCLFGDPLPSQGFRLPPKWQRDPLGKLVHAALLRFFEEEQPGKLLTVTDMRTIFGVKVFQCPFDDRIQRAIEVVVISPY